MLRDVFPVWEVLAFSLESRSVKSLQQQKSCLSSSHIPNVTSICLIVVRSSRQRYVQSLLRDAPLQRHLKHSHDFVALYLSCERRIQSPITLDVHITIKAPTATLVNSEASWDCSLGPRLLGVVTLA